MLKFGEVQEGRGNSSELPNSSQQGSAKVSTRDFRVPDSCLRDNPFQANDGKDAYW